MFWSVLIGILLILICLKWIVCGADDLYIDGPELSFVFLTGLALIIIPFFVH